LVIAGGGPLERTLRSAAGKHVAVLGKVRDDELRWLYANCSAVVAASFEDCGLTPLEAATFGKPSIVLRWGGFLDTVLEGTTGVFFDAPEAESIANAIRSLEHEQLREERIRDHASQFGEERFVARLRDVVADELRAAGRQPAGTGAVL
jgi:glycosyltransferase involved in cell wall biosynthesis